MVKLWQIFALVTLAALISGCCSVCNFSRGTDTSTFTLASHEYDEKEISLGIGSTLSYTVTTEGSPVDIYVMDDPNYLDYADNGGSWDPEFEDVAYPSASGTFQPTKAGTYHFVVENVEDADSTVTWNLNW